jgi:hypothetical protein
MAVLCNKTSIDKLRKKENPTKTSAFGYGLGGNDVTSRPQTIQEQAPVMKNDNPESLNNLPSDMNKSQISLSEEELIKMLEEA